MTEAIVVIVFVALSIALVFGISNGHDTAMVDLQQKCVLKYSDMPHNKVYAHCKEILEFKK